MRICQDELELVRIWSGCWGISGLGSLVELPRDRVEDLAIVNGAGLTQFGEGPFGHLGLGSRGRRGRGARGVICTIARGATSHDQDSERCQDEWDELLVVLHGCPFRTSGGRRRPGRCVH